MKDRRRTVIAMATVGLAVVAVGAVLDLDEAVAIGMAEMVVAYLAWTLLEHYALRRRVEVLEGHVDALRTVLAVRRLTGRADRLEGAVRQQVGWRSARSRDLPET